VLLAVEPCADTPIPPPACRRQPSSTLPPIITPSYISAFDAVSPHTDAPEAMTPLSMPRHASRSSGARDAVIAAEAPAAPAAAKPPANAAWLTPPTPPALLPCRHDMPARRALPNG